jgi:hypothetical protein
MATAATRSSIIQLVVLATNQAPGTTQLSTLVALSDSGSSLTQIAATLTSAATFTSTYPSFATNGEFAKEYIDNIIPSATATVRAAATVLVEGLLNDGASKTDIVVASSAFLATAPTTDPSFGTAAATFQNKVTVAEFHTITLELDTNLAGALVGVTNVATTVTAAQASLGTGASAGGTTFALTTGTDAIVGGPGNDAINAAAGTLASGDTINGGAGTDILNITATGTAPGQTAATLSGVEVVNLTASPNPLSISMAGVTGVTDINNSNSANGATVTVSGVGAPVNSTLTGGQAATTIGYAAAVTAGTAVTDAATLTLAGTALGASYTATGIDQLTINSTKAANTLTTLGVASAATVTVTGDQALTIGGTVGGALLTTVNAAEFTGTTLSMTAGNGVAGTASAGVAVTLPTAATVTSTITTGAEKDTITLGAGNATVVAGGDNDTINSGVGTNTIMGGAGNDAIKLTGTKDTLRYAETGAANADTIAGFSSSSVIAVNLGTAATATAVAVADADFGVAQAGATSPTFGNVDGKGTGTAIVFQGVSATATTTSNPVAAGSNVLALNGAFTNGTAAGVETALGTSATTAITTVAASKFLVATYSVGDIAQVWAYNGDDNADGNINAAELALVATLSGVTQNSLTAANFATYITAGAAAAGTVSNLGQAVSIATPLNLVNNIANANGAFLTSANDTVTVSQGMLPTGASTATMGLTIIDPEGASDNDTLSATVLNQGWDLGTLISNIENVNLELLATDNGFAMASILPGTDVLTFTGLGNTGDITNIITGTTFGLGSTYTGQIRLSPAAATDDFSLNVNGAHATATSTTTNFLVDTAMDNLIINTIASGAVNMDTDDDLIDDIIIRGSNNLTIYDASAQVAEANITAGADFTGTFTIALTDAAAALDFSTATADIVGLDVLDISRAGGNPAVTIGAVAGGGRLTINHAPAAAGTAGNITLTQLGTAATDALTVSLGANSAGTGNITAANTESLTVSFNAATTTLGNVAVSTAAGANTATFSGGAADALVVGTMNATSINTSGVTGAVTIGDLTNAVGTTTFVGGAGNTTITAFNGAANGNITTGIGNDNITTGTGDDVINVGNGTNTVATGNGTDSITSGSGVDTLNGGAGADTLIGGAGNDIYVFGEAAAAGETITDSAGTDRLDVTVGSSMAAINAGVSLATGGIEQVLITAGATATFVGAQLSGTTTNVNATAAGATTLAVTVVGTPAVDLSNLTFTVSNTQNAFDTGVDVITITGDGANNEITGTSIADTITAGAGNDTIVTGTGADVINFTGVGTNGQDTITDFIVGTDTLGLVAADTTAGTAGGANAVVEDEAAPAANGNGTTYDLAAVLAANTNAVDLVTLDTAVLTNLANANLANATDGTELLKALVAAGVGNAASTITVDNNNNKFYIAVDDGTNGYLYLADSDGNQFVQATEITLVGTFNSALIDGVVAAQTVMV